MRLRRICFSFRGDELLASDAWFARKFDETVDSKILDALDEHLKQRAGSTTATQMSS